MRKRRPIRLIFTGNRRRFINPTAGASSIANCCLHERRSAMLTGEESPGAGRSRAGRVLTVRDYRQGGASSLVFRRGWGGDWLRMTDSRWHIEERGDVGVAV